MKNKGSVAAIVLAIFVVASGALLFSRFSPYDICVSYYTNQASSSMGSGAVGYAENLCDKKIRFWR